eukprot:scaffold3309_cov276-Pinguiococcus_pyrenoidosus.AAC.2
MHQFDSSSRVFPWLCVLLRAPLPPGVDTHCPAACFATRQPRLRLCLGGCGLEEAHGATLRIDDNGSSEELDAAAVRERKRLVLATCQYNCSSLNGIFQKFSRSFCPAGICRERFVSESFTPKKGGAHLRVGNWHRQDYS